MLVLTASAKIVTVHGAVRLQSKRGLEPILAQEIVALGYDCNVEAGGVTIQEVTPDLLHFCHLNLGAASHILLRYGKPFTARGLPELTRKVSKQPWHKFINSKSLPVQMRVTSKKSKLNHNTAIRTAILEGINKWQLLPSTELESPLSS